MRLVKDTYEDARTQVKTSIGLTGKITVRVGLHQGSSLSPHLFDMILDVMGRGIKEQPPWCMRCADDIVLCSTRRDHVERKHEEWRTAMEERPHLEYWYSSLGTILCKRYIIIGERSKKSHQTGVGTKRFIV